MEHRSLYTNTEGAVLRANVHRLISFIFIKRNDIFVCHAGKVENDAQLIVVQVCRGEEGIEQDALELPVARVGGAEALKPEDNLVLRDLRQRSLFLAQLLLEDALLLLQFEHLALGAVGQYALHNGGHQIVDGLPDVFQPELDLADAALLLALLVVGNGIVGDPVGHVILQHIVYDGLGNRTFRPVAGHVFLVAFFTAGIIA